MHNYNASKIWNCDKFGVQASHNGDALMFAKIKLKRTHSIILDEKNRMVVYTILHQHAKCFNGYVTQGMDDYLLVFHMNFSLHYRNVSMWRQHVNEQ